MSEQKTKIIDKLTPEQEAKIPYYLEKYRKIGFSTTSCDRKKAEDAIARSYVYMQKHDTSMPNKPLKFLWADSPFAGAKMAANVAAGRDPYDTSVTREETRDQANKASYGSFEAYWVALYDFIGTELDVKKDELLDIVKDIVNDTGVYWTFEEVVIITEKPVAIHINAENKLHNPNGLALEYADGTGVFAVNGVRYKSMMDMAIAEEAKAAEGV
jgi:hypothetical protein